MNERALLNVWGGGQLFCFSGIDGKTDFDEGLVLRTVADIAAFEVKLPAAGGIVLLGDSAPAECFLAGDHFRIVTGRGEVVRGAMVDAYHLLLEGNCRVLGLADALRIRRDGMKTLLGVRSRFRPGLLDSDFDSLFAARRSWLDGLKLPESLSEASRRAAAKACSMLKTQVCSPEGRLNHFWSTPDRWPHRRMWLWDSVFHAVGMRRLDPGLARDFISAVFDVSREDGFIPHAASPAGSSEITQPPILAYGIAKVEEMESDPEWVRGLYPRLKRFLEWIFTHRDSDGAGLMEWAIEAHADCRSGESGMDNSPRFDGAIQLDAPDFNAYLAHECELMARFAEHYGFPADISYWQAHHDRLNRLMNERLWEDAEGLYTDYDVTADRRTNIYSSAGFLPLLSGTPSKEQAARMVKQLTDPAKFGTPFGVPSISRLSEAAYAKDMWRGPVWININYLICEGLRRYGYLAEADRLQRESMREIEKFYLKYGTFFEFYDDRRQCDPPQLLRKRSLDPDDSPYHQVFFDYGWTGTLYLDMVFGSRMQNGITPGGSCVPR